MSEEERLLQWLLAGGDPQAPCPNPAWRRLLRGDPFWRQLAEEIRRWDRQVGEQVRQGPLPEPPSGRLRQRVRQLVQAAVAAGLAGSQAARGAGHQPGEPAASAGADLHCSCRRRSWPTTAAVGVLAALVLAWWFWPPASVRLARSAWEVLHSAEFNRPEHWLTHRGTDPADEVPPVLRISRRVRWRAVQLGRWQGVVHHLMNHEAQSVQAWLFVLRGKLKAVPDYPPKQPQWQSVRAVAGCWFDPRRRRTYVLVVPGTVQQYRFWITAGPLANRFSQSRPEGCRGPVLLRRAAPQAAWAVAENRLF